VHVGRCLRRWIRTFDAWIRVLHCNKCWLYSDRIVSEEVAIHTSAFILLVGLLVIAAGLSPVWPGTVWWRWLAVERSQPSNMITRRERPAVCPQSGQKVPLPKLSLRVVELSAGCARGNPSTDRETQQCSDSCELDSCHIQSPKSLPFPTEASGYHEYTAFHNSLVPEPRVAAPPLLPR
jgi:hypothetical protein